MKNKVLVIEDDEIMRITIEDSLYKRDTEVDRGVCIPIAGGSNTQHGP